MTDAAVTRHTLLVQAVVRTSLAAALDAARCTSSVQKTSRLTIEPDSMTAEDLRRIYEILALGMRVSPERLAGSILEAAARELAQPTFVDDAAADSPI